MLNRELLFPLAAAINFFSVTGLLIICGLFGKLDLAADIAAIQGAVLAVFLSLSGNARSIVLGGAAGGVIEQDLFYFRLIFMIPASVAVFYLTSSTVEPPILLLTGLIVRKCCEWIAELQLANRELDRDFQSAYKYILVNTVSFMALVAVLLVPGWDRFFYWILFLWAVMPLTFVFSFLRYVAGLERHRMNFAQLLPHMGSTVAIGVSTYVFRILIILLAGKILAGQMFTAYALGGVLSSLYVYAFGPSLMLSDSRQTPLYASIAVCLVIAAIVISAHFALDLMLYSEYFLLAIGFSFIGGGIMILAQRQRLYILQNQNRDVFVPDAASNILLISSIPFAFFLFGDLSFTVFFLWSALLHLLFYAPMVIKIDLENVRQC